MTSRHNALLNWNAHPPDQRIFLDKPRWMQVAEAVDGYQDGRRPPVDLRPLGVLDP